MSSKELLPSLPEGKTMKLTVNHRLTYPLPTQQIHHQPTVNEQPTVNVYQLSTGKVISHVKEVALRYMLRSLL